MRNWQRIFKENNGENADDLLFLRIDDPFSTVVSWASVAVSESTVDVFAYDNSSSGGQGVKKGFL